MNRARAGELLIWRGSTVTDTNAVAATRDYVLQTYGGW
jgi:hypothetical protein